MRKALQHHSIRQDTIFQKRGSESSRLEQLSDGVFALAITLLLISSNIPKTGAELISFTGDILAFALSTLVLIVIWYQHYLYFLRFGLSDGPTIRLNTFLLLVVLFYVYPLKFVISFLLRYFGYLILMVLGIDYDQEAFHTLVTSVSSWEMLPTIMMIYSAGYFSLMLALALMYRHALHKQEFLSLSALEQWKSSKVMYQFFIQAAVAVLSILISAVARFTGTGVVAIVGGFIYFLVGPLVYFLEKSFDKKKPQHTDTTRTPAITEASQT